MDPNAGPERTNDLPSADLANPEAAVPDGGWLMRNGPYLFLFAALFAYLRIFQGLDLIGFWNIFKAVLGLGTVVFIHELGHFAVAKWCDVHVETFSIGFGPPLPGCAWRWGETTYMIALIPLGGYVKMVGEGAESDEADTDPRSFKNKSVGQRMAIISAGVIMNVALAFVCFVYVFMTRGAEYQPGIMDHLDAGAPAWRVGAQSGDIIHQIGNETGDPSFNKLQPVVMLSKSGEELTFVFSPPGVPPQQWTRTEVVPRKDEDDQRPMLGFGPPRKLELYPPRSRRLRNIPVTHGSAAAQAEPPFEWGDQIIGSTDPDRPGAVNELPRDPRDPEGKQYDYFAFGRRMQRLAGQPVVIRVRRAAEDGATTPHDVDIRVPAAYHYTHGMRMRMGKITAVRDRSAAAQAGVQPGDIIETVEVADAGGKTLRFVSDRASKLPSNVVEEDLDPERLPFQLEQWADRVGGKDRVVSLTVIRTNPPPLDGNPENHKELRHEPLKLRWDDSWRFNKEVPMGFSSPLSVPELGLAYRIETTVEGVRPGSPAAQAGIQRHDVIKEIRFYALAGRNRDRVEPDRWTDLKSYQWAFLNFYLQQWDVPDRLDVRVERNKTVEEKTLTLVQDEQWPLADRGLFFMVDTRLLKADGLVQATGMGIDKTVNFVMQIYGNLRGFATGRLSPKLLAGPLTIGMAAYSIAGENIYEFITFLGIISVNLAVINFLPIPVLDGGHMIFLIYEKLRGRPASESVRVAATYLGLALIVSLMIFVLILDAKRHI